MTAAELATKYYPRMWDVDRLKSLVVAGKLTADEYETITGAEYVEVTE